MTFVLLFGGSRVIEGDLGIGVLTAALLYTRQFFGPIERIAVFYNSYQSASAALEKISGVLEEEPTVPEPEKPAELGKITGELDFKDVEFNYSNNIPILPHFSLNIPAGQTIALVGTTGAGKSTLAKLISRFYDPVSGEVSLDGIDLRDISSEDLRRHIVMVTQEAYLFSGSVADNIALGKPGASREEIAAAAQAVGAHEFILELPDGYDTDVNKRGGLDIPSERQVQRGLQTLLKGRTAVIIAHRLSTVAIADRVLVMEHGEIIEDDKPDVLIAGEGKFSKLHKAWRESLV
jgi:ATP-binding cassette subfamily B protein